MSWTPENWLYPENGACHASVGIASPAPEVVDVVAVMNPIALFGYRRLAAFLYNGRWSSPTYLNGPARAGLRDTAPVAISRTPNVTDVFAVGSDDMDGRMLTWWNVEESGAVHRRSRVPRGYSAVPLPLWRPGILGAWMCSASRTRTGSSDRVGSCTGHGKEDGPHTMQSIAGCWMCLPR
jgi:hypothetical protein